MVRWVVNRLTWKEWSHVSPGQLVKAQKTQVIIAQAPRGPCNNRCAEESRTLQRPSHPSSSVETEGHDIASTCPVTQQMSKRRASALQLRFGRRE